MKHSTPLEPTPSAESIPSMPDRTDLSRLYPEAKGMGTINHSEIQESVIQDDRTIIIRRVVVSLLLFVPVLSMYLLILFITQNAAKFPPEPLASLQNFYATGVCLLFWFLSLRALGKQFEKCNISLGIFIVFYLFYLFPTIKLTYGLLKGDDTGIIIALSIVLAVTHFAVFYMTWALNRQASSYGNRMLMVALPILILAISASLF